jgi:hypothetical protein
MNGEPWETYRRALKESMQRAVDQLDAGHTALLQQQLNLQQSEENLLPALVCLRVADRLVGDADLAIAPATSLALLVEMASVFVNLDAPEDAGQLSASWGLPRSLNASDALFAMAQDVLLSSDEISVERRLQAVKILDEASRAFVTAIHETAANNQEGLAACGRALHPAAVRLAAVFAGKSADAEKLTQLGGRLREAAGAEEVTTLTESFRP